jgi:tetratricopeptide (TPR) repeat protein
MRTSVKNIKMLIFVLWILFSLSCSKSGTGGENVNDLLNKAWTEFEAKNYDTAKDLFTEISQKYPEKKKDASEGLGWCYLMQNRSLPATDAQIDTALQYFNDASFLTDANAGKSIILHARGEYADAIDRAEYVLSKDANYSFSHYPSVDDYALHWIIAHSALQLGDFTRVVQELMLLDPSRTYDPNSPDELLNAVNNLWVPII